MVRRLSISSSGKRKENSGTPLLYVTLGLLAVVMVFFVNTRSQIDTRSLTTLIGALEENSQEAAKDESTHESVLGNSENINLQVQGSAPLSPPKAVLRNDLQSISADDMWNALVEEGANILKTDQSRAPLAVIEVGVHRATQCMHAANAGFEAHCVEPSPRSFQRIQTAVRQAPMDVQRRMHLHNVAAGPSSEGTVQFTSTGGTGDHVGKQNMWTMEQETQLEQEAKPTEIIEIPSKKLDDIIQNDMKDKTIFLLKVDTQGFEPAVFAGAQESLQQHKIPFILTEYWPRGMDLLMGKERDTCVGATMLQSLTDLGYTLYAMPTLSHPRAPQGWKRKMEVLGKTRPSEDLAANCQWYFEVEKENPPNQGEADYKMGYWSDVLAVAPGVSLSNPITEVGKVFQAPATPVAAS